MIENVLLVALMLSPIAMIVIAMAMKRSATKMKPWDKSFRTGMLLAFGGVILGGSGLYAYANAAGTRSAPFFGVPVVLGVVLIVTGYRTWMRGVSQIPEDGAGG